MNFELDRAQKQIQKAVKDFIKGEFDRETIEGLLFEHQFPESIWKKAGDLGLLGMQYPEDLSGQGLGLIETVLVAEALCRGDSSVGICLSRAALGAELLLHYGDPAQKKKWLPLLAESRILSCAAIAEPGVGNDITRCRTTARKEGQDWVIEGIKTFVINAGPMAGFYLVLCRTDSDAKDSQNVFTILLVETDRAGIETSDMGPRIGAWLLPVKQVHFNRVRVPEKNVLGKVNNGFKQITAYMSESQISAAAQCVGVALGAFDRAQKWVRQREQFGQKLVHFQITRQKLSDMATRIESARTLTYQAAWFHDTGHGKPGRSAMVKLLAAKTAVSVCDEAIQLLGGYGYIQEYEVERFFRDAKFLEAFDGNSITLKETIAEELAKGKTL